MSKQLRAALVGCGGMSDVWLDALAALGGVEVAGLIDIQPENARARAQRHGLSATIIGTDLKQFLDSHPVDVVLDCTIPEAHYATTMEALRHGCHVLGEKPMADNMDHAQTMTEAARHFGRIYAVIQNRRYDPQLRQIKAFFNTGALGPITTVHCDFFIGAHFGGFREQMAHPLLLDMAIHTFDAARFLTAADPCSVYCREWNPAGSWYAHGASAVAIFELSGGIVCNYRGSWCSEGLQTPWESEWRIIGQKGSLTWRGEQIRVQVATERSGFFSDLRDLYLPSPEAQPFSSWHAANIHEFLDCVRTGKTPQTVCHDNIKSLAMAFGAIESARTKALVPIHCQED